MKFTKKPVEIDAVQITDEWFDGPPDQNVRHATYAGCVDKVKRCVVIDTLGGQIEGYVGDWIITGVKGEKYPCKDDIFRMTYDPTGGTWCESCNKPVLVLGQDYTEDVEGTALCMNCRKITEAAENES